MVGTGGFIIGALGVAIGLFYQFALKDFLFVLGVTRDTQSIEEFTNYSCRRVQHELLEGCEDMWLDDKHRKLYGACSSVEGREAWTPGGSDYNATGRKETDHFVVLNIDEPGKDGFFGLQKLEISGNYKSATGAGVVDLHGFDVEHISDSQLRFWVINHRPPFDPETGKPLDSFKHGANSTIEIFDHTIGSSKLNFVKTIFEPLVIETPNNLVLTGDGGFLATNDHYSKVGLRRDLGLFLGGGSIAYYSPTGKSQILAPQPDPTSSFSPSKFYFPNGLARGKDGLFYMADSGAGTVSVFTLTQSASQTSPTLTQIDSINIKLPNDNLSVDSEGTIWVAGFPKSKDIVIAMISGAPKGEPVDVATTIMSIKKVGEGQGNLGWKREYLAEKVLEDGEAKILSMSTVAVHDVATGNIFIGSVKSGFIGVCDKQ